MNKFLEFLNKQKKRITVSLIIIVSILLDQISKIIVVNNIEYIMQNKPITVIKGILNITYTENDGAAFGMLDDQRWIFMTVSIIAILGIGTYLLGFCKEGWLYQIGLALIVGGGIGNMIDRIAYGYVVDMLEFAFVDFAVFNVADSFVCIGAGLVMLMLIIELVKSSGKKDDSKQEEAQNELKEQAEENDNN